MKELLEKKSYRTPFILIIILITMLVLFLKIYVLPDFDPSIKFNKLLLIGTFLDSLVISLITTVMIGMFIFWLEPEVMRLSKIDVIEPKEINPLLKSALTTTRFWIYKGSCGRYTRATTLPRLAESARIKGIGRDISLYILNPNNTLLCEEYSTYRRSLKSCKNQTEWSPEAVQEELISTAVVALKYIYTEPLLNINLYFVESFSTFRFDISEQYVVITKEDNEASALKADAGTYFYDSYKDDIRIIQRQSLQMTYEKNKKVPDIIDKSTLLDLIKCSNICNINKLKSLDINKIIELINKPKDPY